FTTVHQIYNPYSSTATPHAIDASGTTGIRDPFKCDRGPRSIAFERIPNACRAAGVNGVRRRCCGGRVVDLMDSGEQASARVGEISVQLSRRWNIITSVTGLAVAPTVVAAIKEGSIFENRTTKGSSELILPEGERR